MDSIIPPTDPSLKRCPNCPEDDQWHPATTEFFGRDKNQKDKLCRVCKKCKNAYYRDYNKLPQSRAWKKDYLSKSENQERVKQYSKTYYESPKGREHGRAYRREYESRPDVRERRKDYYKPWREAYQTSPEYHAYQDTYHERPEVQAHKKAYRGGSRYKELHRANSHRRRSRQKDVQGVYTPEQIQVQLKRQKYRCYYAACGHAKFKRVKEDGQWKYEYHIEHTYPLDRVAGTDIPANDMSYLVLSCKSCNSKKGNKFPWEFPEGGRLL